MSLKDHTLVPAQPYSDIVYAHRPARRPDGSLAEGLHHVWISLNNPKQLNAYSTQAVKELILAFGRASHDRAAVCVVFTGVGHRAFCTGGDIGEYATYYAGRPEEFRQYMRLFADMISAILRCEKPVICRVNGLRVGGGQELGMACDFSIAQDLSRFGQAGTKHGSAPDGGSTDFLPLFVGVERAMSSCATGELWSAHKALSLGLLSEVVPALRVAGEWTVNPLVHRDGVDAFGCSRVGEAKTGDALIAAKAQLKSGVVDLSLLDEAVERRCAQLLMTLPGCLSKTLQSLRKHKLQHWDRNRETNLSWFGLNMMTEGGAGFRAFNDGDRANRSVDYVELRRRLAAGERWSEALVQAIAPAGLRPLG